MPNSEHTEGHTPSENQPPPVEIGITPFADAGIVFERAEDGRLTLRTKGEIIIAILPTSQAAESPLEAAPAPESGLLPDTTPPPVTEAYSAADKPSSEETPTLEGQVQETENQKFELVGNPVRDPSYKERKSGKRIADFVLATHPDEESTQYWRIRAFDKQADKVRDQVRKGQTGIEATVYGPKHWKGQKKTKEGRWEETEVTGYYAGFVKVPKKYRSQEKPSGTQEPPQQEKN